MGMIEDRWRFSRSRRRALASFAAIFGASPLLKAQVDPHGLVGHKRIRVWTSWSMRSTSKRCATAT